MDAKAIIVSKHITQGFDGVKLSNIKLFQMDATNMQFKDECFDKIVLSVE